MEQNSEDKTRVLFLGDGNSSLLLCLFNFAIYIEGVGKTSIIITIVSETFPRTVNKTYHPVNLSQELYMLPIDTNTVLVDSSCKTNDDDDDYIIFNIAAKEDE